MTNDKPFDQYYLEDGKKRNVLRQNKNILWINRGYGIEKKIYVYGALFLGGT
jgi:hypothetical protein